MIVAKIYLEQAVKSREELLMLGIVARNFLLLLLGMLALEWYRQIQQGIKLSN